jgi:hypothetical protein
MYNHYVDARSANGHTPTLLVFNRTHHMYGLKSNVVYDAPHRGPHSVLSLWAIGSYQQVNLGRLFFTGGVVGNEALARPAFYPRVNEAHPARRWRRRALSQSRRRFPPPQSQASHAPLPPLLRLLPVARAATPSSSLVLETAATCWIRSCWRRRRRAS